MCRIIFHLFYFYYAEMRKKLRPKAPAKEGAVGQMSKNFQVYFIHINFFKKPNNTFLEYCDATIFVFWFFIDCLPKENGNCKMAQGCRLSSTPFFFACCTFRSGVRESRRWNNSKHSAFSFLPVKRKLQEVASLSRPLPRAQYLQLC